MSENIDNILTSLSTGEISVDEATSAVQHIIDKVVGYADLGYARADLSREARQGAGEVVYGQGKTAEQIVGISAALVDEGQDRVLITRLDTEKADQVQILWSKEQSCDFQYFNDAHLGIIGSFPDPDGDGTIVVAAAGTSDLTVAAEAALTAQFLGNEVVRLFDVGVSGIHRLLSCEDELVGARVVIAVAGMEGALASVIGGMVSCPVIAVPTSVGYGASFGGLSALLSMLNSCASGVSVVNIDNGFGAGFQASLINHLNSRASF